MSTPTPNQAHVAARTNLVTVLFADISGFTAMSEKLDPEAVTDIMNRCFTELEGVVVAHGGAIDKYIGDCVMAVFGTEKPESDAAEAVAAAAEIIQALDTFNQREGLASPLGVHIGLEAGETLIGEIGGREHRTVSVSGPAVAIASRLEDISDVGEIFVGPSAFRDTERYCDYESRDAISVRDVGEQVPVYQYVRHKHLRELVRRNSERRQATVVFASINGFKELAAGLDPAAVNEILNLCFGAMESAVQAYGGVIDKYIGETVMALFGVPDAIEDAPKQAVNATIEMRKRLRNLFEQGSLPAELGLSAGVNSGLVIAGEVGGRVKKDFTVMGDAVNLAARLKESAAAGQILCGPETHRYIRGDFEFASPEALSLKGKSEPVPAYRVLSTREQVYRSAGSAQAGRLISSTVGREAEMAAATRLLDELADGRGGMLTRAGEAGCGKARLYSGIAREASQRGMRLLEGRSLAVGKNLRFHPFVDLLRQWTGALEDDSQEAQRLKLRGALEAVSLENEDVFPFAATLMGIELETADATRLSRMEPEGLERLFVRSVRRIFTGLATTKPTVVVFEDLHWADQSSIHLLESLLPVAGEAPLLYANVCRPDMAETAGRIIAAADTVLADRHVAIDLQPLNEDEAARLVESLLQIDELPPRIRKWVAAKTEGNPFYIEEVVHSLIDSGAIVETEGTFRIAKDFDEIEMPGTIQEVIMARVDRLPPPTRHVLQVASVIGRSFYYSIIHEILRRQGQLDRQCDEDLQALRDREILIESEAGWTVPVGDGGIIEELEYIFKHALAQETIYNSLLHKVRKGFHQTVGDTIESLFDDRLSDFYGMLAYHFGQAEDLQKAEDYLFYAGEDAARSAASSEALAYFREADRVYAQLHGSGGDPDRKALLQKHIGMALLNTGELNESIDHFDHALVHYGIPFPKGIIGSNAFLAFNAVALFGQLYLGVGRKRHVENWQREQEVCDTQFNRARAQITSDPVRLVYDTIHIFRRFNEIDMSRIVGAPAMYASAAGMFCYSALSFSASRKALDYTKELAKHGNSADRFTYNSMEFIIHYLRGQWERSAELIIPEEVVRDALRSGQLWDANTYLGLECDQRLRQGNFAESARLLDLLGVIADDYGFDFAATNLLGMKALERVEQRELDEALELTRRYRALVGEVPRLVLALGTQTKIHALRGELAEAEDTLAEAEATADPLTTPPWHMNALAAARLRLRVEQLTGRRADHSLRRQARRSIRQALAVSRKAGIQETEILALAGTAEWLGGSKRRARSYWQRAASVGKEMGALPELARAHHSIGRHLETAGESLDEAERLFSQLGFGPQQRL